MQINRTVPENLLPCSSEYLQKTNPYYIVAPDYSQRSSGIRVLHELCSVLNQMGYESYVTSVKTNGDLWTPRLSEEIKTAHYCAKKIPIVVYPEVVKGQPINIGLPVRYVLSYPGFIGGDKTYDESELIFSHLKEYYPEGTLLYLPTENISKIDSIEAKYKRAQGSSAVYFNRAKPQTKDLNSFGESCIEISSRKPMPYEEMISILKSVEVLYCYESSAIVADALFSGCAVVYIQNEFMKEMPDIHKNLSGVSWGNEPSSVQKAIDSVSYGRNEIIDASKGWVDRLVRFIDLTQEKANKLSFEKAWPQSVVDSLSLPNLSHNDIAERHDRKKYERINQDYKEWRSKSSLREINADIYAEHIINGNLPAIDIVISHNVDTELSLIAETIDSIAANFYGGNSIIIVSYNDPPEGFENGHNLKWLRKESLNENPKNHVYSKWLLVVEAGTKLSPQTLVELALSAKSQPDIDLFYSDEDIYSSDGSHCNPNFKPSFNIELIRCTNYVGASVLFRVDCWINSNMPISAHEIYRYLIVKSLSKNSSSICHVDGMLFHGTGKITATTEKNEFETAQSELMASGLVKAVRPMDRLGSWLVEYSPLKVLNTTLVIPTGHQTGYMRQMLESLFKYGCINLAEIILVCNLTDLEEVEFALIGLEKKIPINIITYVSKTYNHAKALNMAIAKVVTDYVWVCDDDVEFIHEDALGILLSLAKQDTTACVEPRLMSTHGVEAKIVGGPIILGIQGCCGSYTGEMQLPEEYGYLSKLQLTQDVSAISGHCFVFRKAQWEQVGGFDENQFSLKFPVLDFCLKLNQKGWRHIWTPQANVMHQGGKSLQKRLGDFEFKVAFAQSDVKEKDKLIEVWGLELANDRYYNRHLSLLRPYDLEATIVVDWSPVRRDRLRVLANPLISGAGQYRVVEPLNMLQEHSLAQTCVILPKADRKTRILQPIELIRANPDTLILQHSVDDAQLSLIEAYKRYLPKVHIVQMVDDLLGFVPEKHPNRRFQSREGHQRMVEALKKCDSMIVTTQPLNDHYKKYLKSVQIIPNCLSKQWFDLKPAKTKKEKLRVGWIGAGQHQGDLEIINEVVKELSDRVDWIFMGMQTDQAKPYIKEFYKFVSIKDYPEKMASLDLDIAVAPLEDNFFNQCKSNLRLLEYGAMSWPVVCSDVYTYKVNNPPVIHCKPIHASWIQAINSLIEDEQLRIDMGRNLNEWVKQNYNLDNWSNEWLMSLGQNVKMT